MYKWRLGIEKYKDLILDKIEKNKTVIIKGPTGCGKTTYLPLLLKDKKVAIIQPRRISVYALYESLKSHLPNVGYKMRFEQIKVDRNKPHTMIFTDGAFLMNFDLEYDFVIVDEVHERSERIDVLLILLNKYFKNKLILMSATLETVELEKYFSAKTIEIKCKTNKLKRIYLEKPTADYITTSFLKIKEILQKKENVDGRRDILVFLPTVEDINELSKNLKRIVGCNVHKVYSQMSEEKQRMIFEKTPGIKIILSTNICETSLTIPSVKYVIDSGLVKNKVFDGISYFGIQKISSESEKQREGRCNRTGEGVCYKMYTKDTKFYNSSPTFSRIDVSSVFLFCVYYKINILTCEFLSYPTVKGCKYALENLCEKGCIEICEKQNNINIKITNHGKKMILLPFELDLAHFYELSCREGCGYFATVFVTLASLENYNFLMLKEKDKINDIEYMVFVFEEYVKAKDKEFFCKQFELPIKGMSIAFKIFSGMKNKMTKGGIDDFLRLFSKCFSYNKCVRQTDGSYIHEKTGRKVWIHPSSTFFKRKVQKIVCVNFFCTSKAYCRIVGQFYGI